MIFHCTSLTLLGLQLATVKTMGNHGISDLFSKLSHLVFRVIHSYLVFRELYKYVFRENTSFKEIFFSCHGVNFGPKFRSFWYFCSIRLATYRRSLFPKKSMNPSTKLMYLEEFSELGDPPLFETSGESLDLTSLKF